MRPFLLFFLAVLLIFPVAVFADDDDRHDGDDRQDMDWQLEMAERQFELKQRQAVQERDFNHESEMQNLEIEQARKRIHGHGKGAGGLLAVFFLFALIVNILLTVWVYMDIRKRDSGSGIWIVITLFAGLFGAAVYALVRIGDIRLDNGGTSKAKR